MQKKRRLNLKRAIAKSPSSVFLTTLAAKVIYTGSPYHKRVPGDFGLVPPSEPRTDASLCDGTKIFQRSVAQRLLKKGIEQGLVSIQERAGFPQNIWAVTDDQIPVEAQLENEVQGTYHGYPMQNSDPLSREILRRWKTDLKS